MPKERRHMYIQLVVAGTAIMYMANAEYENRMRANYGQIDVC